MPLRRSVICALIAALALSVASTAHAAAGMEVAVQDDAALMYRLWGNVPNTLKLVSQLKATRIRVNVTWSYVVGKKVARKKKAPKRIRYNWSGFDALIRKATPKHMRLQLVLTGPAPAWATSNHKVGP